MKPIGKQLTNVRTGALVTVKAGGRGSEPFPYNFSQLIKLPDLETHGDYQTQGDYNPLGD